MRASVAAVNVMEVSLERKSPSPMVATQVFESGLQAPML